MTENEALALLFESQKAIHNESDRTGAIQKLDEAIKALTETKAASEMIINALRGQKASLEKKT